ncbi:MAG TPA: hypothetical protein VM578_00500 [Candidatus Saccharimonadales bacterium]|nr:hypothetical protein [Candidatus Saccharimonadales bacterium]
MNRLSTLILVGCMAGLLASCGSSVKSSTQPAVHDEYAVVVSPDHFTLNSGDWASISATVTLSNQNSTPSALKPQPTIKFFSSDPRVTISPAGEVCAGQWDARYLTCKPTVFPQCTLDAKGNPVIDAGTGKCVPNPNAGQLDLPSEQLTITVVDPSHSVSGTTLVTVHPRATSIALSAPVGSSAKDSAAEHKYSPTGCVSQGNYVQYVATPDFGGVTGGKLLTNDYTWTSSDTNVAQVSDFGFVVARAPGVANIYAKLNGTISAPLAFATCPPSAILVGSAPFTSGKLPNSPPYNTDDLVLNKGDQKYLIATVTDVNGNALTDLSLDYIASNPVAASFSTVTPLISKLGASTSGNFSIIAACEPSTCNNGVENFIAPGPGPSGTTAFKGSDVGFGYPIYSNAIGATVQGTTSSFVLVTNSDAPNALHRLLVYDSESMTVTQRIELANLPNSLVVAPNGTKAYLGSDTGLVVVDLTSYQSSIQTFPIVGGLSTDFITGKVLGVSPDSRYVVVSDLKSTPNLLFFIDTTGTKAATRFVLPGISAVTFAPDNSNMWVAGTNGVYVYNSDTFVITPSSIGNGGVNALAWVPDGQSYVASGDQVIDYSTCNDLDPQVVPSANGTPLDLSTTVIGGVPHLIGLSSTNQWLNYPVSTTAQAGVTNPEGNVCLSNRTPPSTVRTQVVSAPIVTASGLTCSSPQVSFSPRLQLAFITGYPSVNGVSSCGTAEPVIHGFDVSGIVNGDNGNSIFTLSTLNNSPITPLSGGVLSDGRKLYVGSYDPTNGASTLHRFSIISDTGATPVLTEDFATNTTTTGTPPTTVTTVTIPASVELVPSLVAVVPK